MNDLKLVLGLEVHLHLKTARKMFCGCDANIYGDKPNTHTCPVCLGLPGALPVPNFDAIKMTQMLGLALHCEINKSSKFDRKHYFYPDLPKGYQISQYKEPLCLGGYLLLESDKTAQIERIHLEEDTAKSFHEHGKTLIDFNKSGMPLVEIVTQPIFTDINDAVDFCKQIQEIVRSLGISDVDMEKGQMRLEANISLRTPEMEKAQKLPEYKVEIKNINSFKFMEKAVKAEIVRQSELLNSGQKVLQENRGFDEISGKTVSQREKEEAHDYRYFPEPDIPPLTFDENHINALKKNISELPYEKKERYAKLGLNTQEALFMSLYINKPIALLFEELVKNGANPKKTAALLINKPETRELGVSKIAELLNSKKEIIEDTKELQSIVDQMIKDNPSATADYKKGKTNAVEFIVGQVMRATKGKADTAIVRELILKSFQG